STPVTEEPQAAEGQHQHDEGVEESSEIGDFEQWVARQPDGVQQAFKSHIHGLKSALESERSSNKDLQKRLKSTSAQLDEGSEARKQLDEIQGTLELEERRADFYEQAHDAGI